MIAFISESTRLPIIIITCIIFIIIIIINTIIIIIIYWPTSRGALKLLDHRLYVVYIWK